MFYQRQLWRVSSAVRIEEVDYYLAMAEELQSLLLSPTFSLVAPYVQVQATLAVFRRLILQVARLLRVEYSGACGAELAALISLCQKQKRLPVSEFARCALPQGPGSFQDFFHRV